MKSKGPPISSVVVEVVSDRDNRRSFLERNSRRKEKRILNEGESLGVS